MQIKKTKEKFNSKKKCRKIKKSHSNSVCNISNGYMNLKKFKEQSQISNSFLNTATY